MVGRIAETVGTGLSLLDRLSRGGGERIVAMLERLTTDGSVNDYLLRLRRADTNPVWVELTARADAPAEDRTLRIEALVRDVSERKKLDDETRDIYHQLLQAEKMAALRESTWALVLPVIVLVALPAAMVPPVARRSSTMSTRWPGLIASA